MKSFPWLKPVAGGLLLALAYFLMARLGLLLAFKQAQVSPIWPPTGLALAVLLRFGPRWWPGIFLGALAVNALADEPLAAAIAIATGNTLEALVGAVVLRRFFGFKAGFERVRDVIAFIAVAAVFATAISASIGVASLSLAGIISVGHLAENWLTWWLGDVLGVLVVAPVLLLWSKAGLRWPARRHVRSEAVALSGAVLASTWFAFDHGMGYRFLVFPPLIWAALRFGPRGAVLATLATSALAAWLTIGVSERLGHSVSDQLHYVQVFAGVIAVSTLLLAAVKQEREAAREQLRRHLGRLESEVAARTEEFESSRAALQDFLDNASDLIQSVDLEGRYRFVNRAWCEALGYMPAEAAGITIFDVIAPDRHEHCRTAFASLLSTREPLRLETEFLTKDGRRVPVEGHINVRMEDGRPTLTRGMFRDVTERRRAEQILRESEARYRSVVNNVKDVVFQTDVEGRWTFLNPSWTEITGHAAEDSIGRLFLDYVHPDDRARNLELFRPLIAREKDHCRHEVRYLTKDGSFRWVEAFARLLFDARGEVAGASGTLTDVTAQHVTEDQLRRQIFAIESADDGIAWLDEEGRFLHVNQSHVRIFGYDGAAELLGRGWRELYEPKEAARIEGEVFAALKARGSWSGRAIAKCRDGSTFPEGLSLTVIPGGGLVCICRDISRQVEAEEQLMAAIAQEKRLNDLRARFVSMASHELRTPIATLSLGVEFLLKYRERLSPVQVEENLHAVNEGIRQLRVVLDDLLLLGQSDEGRLRCQPAELDLDAFCGRLIEEAAERDGRLHAIEWRCEITPCQLRLDGLLLRHVLDNLLSNALKYSPEGRSVRLSAHREKGRAVFVVADEGIGIPEQDQPQLFEFFYRASNVGQIPGTGLGLLVVRRCVEAHRGRLDFESAPGRGTTFTVSLPIDFSP